MPLGRSNAGTSPLGVASRVEAGTDAVPAACPAAGASADVVVDGAVVVVAGSASAEPSFEPTDR